jgi:hypothetical protein
MTAENSAALLSGRWSTQECCLSRTRKFINVFAVSKRTDRFSRKLGLSGSTPAERLRPAMQSNENRKALEMSNEKMREAVAEDGSYMAAHRARMEWYENNQNYENIQSDLAGQTYNYDDAESLVDFFTLARQEGLVFPDWLFELAKEYKAESDDPA